MPGNTPEIKEAKRPSPLAADGIDKPTNQALSRENTHNRTMERNPSSVVGMMGSFSSRREGRANSDSSIRIVKKEGYLLKNSLKLLGRTKWKHKYVVLTSKALEEYKSESASKEEKTEEVFSYREVVDVRLNKSTFHVKLNSTKMIAYKAENKEQANEWFELVHALVKDANLPIPIISSTRKEERSPQLGKEEKEESRKFPESPKPLPIRLSKIDDERTDTDMESGLSDTEEDDDAKRRKEEAEEEEESEDGESVPGDLLVEDDGAKKANAPNPTWGSRVKNYFSSSNGDQVEDTASSPFNARSIKLPFFSSLEESKEEEKEKKPNEPFELTTNFFIEDDTIEIFENQRWFPLTKWGQKMLLHDRGVFTDRMGNNRVEFYRNSLIEGDPHETAKNGTSGFEDLEECPGAQVHVIKSPYEWVGDWELAPLVGLNERRGEEEKKKEKKKEEEYDGWGYAFDFPEIDSALARGVPNEKQHGVKASVVRTRRWIRRRRRKVEVTAYLPSFGSVGIPRDIILPLLSFERQVVYQSYLGKRSMNNRWHTRYFKLVKSFHGFWDGGERKGLIAQSKIYSLVLVSCGGKEKQGSKVRKITLSGNSHARILPLNDEDNGLLTNMSMETELLIHQRELEGKYPSPSSSIVPSNLALLDNPAVNVKTPRCGRFEIRIQKDEDKERIILLSADSRVSALMWVHEINKSIEELNDKHEEEKETKKKSIATPRSRLNLFKKRKKERDIEELNEDEEKNDKIVFADNGETLTPCSFALPATLDLMRDGKELQEFAKGSFPLPSLNTFFQLFIGDKSSFYPDYHNAVGDSDYVVSLWQREEEGGGKEEVKIPFDFEGLGMARVQNLKTNTGAPVGPKSTRVVKKQFYYFFEKENVLVINTRAMSLDVPFGDAFEILERWIVTFENNKVNVRILGECFFHSSPLLKGTIHRAVLKGCEKNFSTYMKRMMSAVKTKGTTVEERIEKMEETEEKERKNVNFKMFFISLCVIVGGIILSLLGFSVYELHQSQVLILENLKILNENLKTEKKERRKVITLQ